MSQVIEAVFSNGVLRPLEPLTLPEDQRVRLIIDPIQGFNRPTDAERREALKRLFAGLDSMRFNSGGRLPTREELHDRD